MWVLKVSPTYKTGSGHNSFDKLNDISPHRVNMAKEVNVDTGPHLCKIYLFSSSANWTQSELNQI